ncbi:antirestriction protein ArdC [Variovorax boronicumulans]|uniref:ArdC family protein n=1 Tax=Variovorax boronicumulans TaxID=436515 RepID=UPI002475B6B6|nr:zincin-like metallopeptidase domain-containing protein [Variovorax boronicumulans]MDH6170073.1 antirestriction protein ArdC [Variovorax boronicumulans]
MHANSTSSPRDAGSPHNPGHPTATGVPPVPPEDSPKAGGSLGESAGTAARGRDRMDVRQVVTDRIIAMLEKGGSVFRERWARAAARGVPRNGKTGAPYRGANVLLLWEAAIEAGYASNVWLTYRQAQSLGAQVRKGERGVLCAHFERKARERRGDADDVLSQGGTDEEAMAADAGARAGVLLCLPFWLFNAAQIDGLPLDVVDLGVVAPAENLRVPVERAMRLLGGCNATIRHGFDRAAYLPALDEIRLPWPREFTSPEAQCATALHELVHWTGHPDRLNRRFGQRFGDAAYAFEELVAELGSAFVMGHCGLVDAMVEGHAAYIDAWLQVLRGDRTAIFTAARLAEEACAFIVAREMP